jgi:hypothetical protein
MPTLGELLAENEWMWIACINPKCLYSQPTMLAPLVEKYGADRSSDFLRQTAICPRCGHKGASLTARSWSVKRGKTPDWQDFPTHFQNGLWSDRPFDKAPHGSRFEAQPIDTRPPGPFRFGD